MNTWYDRKKEEILNVLETSSEGLTDEQVTKRLDEYGENILYEEEKKSILWVFVHQFADLMILILMAAAVISIFTGDMESACVIFAVLLLNAILGTMQYKKAEKSLDALKSLSSPAAKVIRNGRKIELDSRSVVPGDLLLLEAGDMVIADGRILENYSLQVNESTLTGESANVDKQDVELYGQIPLGDRINMVYSGSLVTYGRAKVVITQTGMDTEMGKIAELMNQTKERKTPLQVSLDQFSKVLAVAILLICLLVFSLGVYRQMPLMDSLLFAVALAVAAIPEALGSIVTIVQAMGTQKMAKENAIIKNLSAVESLGCVSVICSDKTGTLTQNKMTVQNVYVGGKLLAPEALDMREELHRHLLYNVVLANDASIVDGKGVGDPTEYALLEMYRSIKENQQKDEGVPSEDELRESLGRLEEVPFDSDRKLMSTKHRIGGKETVFTKGAPDVLLDRCEMVWDGSGIHCITKEDRERIQSQNHRFSEQGLRVLAFGYKETEEKLALHTEYGYVFLGLIAMMDPPREESKAAVEDAKTAGIRAVMITGDHKLTATAIAKQIGIFNEGDMAVSGVELDQMSDEELQKKLQRICVYARVSPENKIRIVEAWQKKGNIVAMTGDGVNDAPALKKADVGVAMGITGTEVSKDAASMILADDNFATIIKAVANGRTIYQNIKNAILFLLSGNLSAIITVLMTSLLNLPIPFAAVQLLFINLVTDSLPALAIGMEPGEKDVLRRCPRDPKKGILDREFSFLLLSQGVLLSLGVMTAYGIGLMTSPEMACTMAFATLTLARLFHGFNCRSSKSLIHIGFRNNRYSLAAFLCGTVLLAAVLNIPPLMHLFAAEPLDWKMAGMILLLAILPTILIQSVKMVRDFSEKMEIQ